MKRIDIQKLSRELQDTNDAIEMYNNSNIIDGDLELYLTNRQYELVTILKNWAFGYNIEIL